MSSFIRTIERRIMKKAGLKRFTQTVPAGATKHNPDEPVQISLVADAEGHIYGSGYPRAIPRKFVPTASGGDLRARLKREEGRK